MNVETTEERDSLEAPVPNVDEPHPHEPSKKRPIVPFAVGVGVLLVFGLGGFMVVHAESQVNKVALGTTARPVSVVAAKASTYRSSRTYVGTIEPWVEAKVGPQLVSAYVDTVLVRPGAAVKKGDVLATLDCRNASAASQGIAMQARALDERQKALTHEAARVQGLLDGGFVSPNEAEQKTAQSAEQQAQLLATQAKLLGSSLEVNDCILRAPFNGGSGDPDHRPWRLRAPGHLAGLGRGPVDGSRHGRCAGGRLRGRRARHEGQRSRGRHRQELRGHGLAAY